MMKQQRIFASLAVASYLSIILMGQMIGIPFLFWLLFNLFNFGEVDQLLAVLSVVGLGLLAKYSAAERTLKIVILDVLCFLLLATSIGGRLLTVPIEKFNYAAFIIPLSLFIVFYLVSLLFAYRQYTKTRFDIG